MLPVIPKDSTLKELRPIFTDFLNVVTQPPGATVSVRRIGQRDSTWTIVGRTPLDSLPMPKLLSEMGYEMRLERAGYEPVTVQANLFVNLRTVGGGRAIDTMHLDPVGRPTAGMARIPGAVLATTDGKPVRAGDFYIGKLEVTNREYMRFVAAGGLQQARVLDRADVRGGKPVSWDDGVATLVDRTGQPGPSTWSAGTFPTGEADFPVGGLSYYEAAAYARFAGMQLPTAGIGGRRASQQS